MTDPNAATNPTPTAPAPPADAGGGPAPVPADKKPAGAPTAANGMSGASGVSAAPAAGAQAKPRSRRQSPSLIWWLCALLVALAAAASVALSLMSQQKVMALEQELVRRQQDSQGQSTEARALARQAQEQAQSAEAKVVLMEARVAEASMQRTQLDELIQQMSRSRDESVLADVDAALRVATQQSALTGGAEPLVAALRQAEDRLARLNQPRVERIRRAVALDLERVRAASVADVPGLTIKLDEVMRSIDELPLVAQVDRRTTANLAASAASTRKAALAARKAASAASPSADAAPDWWLRVKDLGGAWVGAVWQEARDLVRVSQLDNADAMLVSPEQSWYVRENLKLRVLNARLALLSRQFDIVQADIRDVRAALDRYFDRQSRRVQLTAELLQQVSSQARTITLPRPDETLAALAAVQAGR